MDDNTPLSEQEKQAVIEQYEKFVNERLKVDLDLVLTDRDKIYHELHEYLELKQNIELIQKQKLSEMTTMINLGSEFYVQAKVPDTSFIFVKIGLGFHAEMTLEEAVSFVGMKEIHLNSKADKLSKQAQEIQNQIHSFQDALEKLMNLPSIETMLENPQKTRNF